MLILKRLIPTSNITVGGLLTGEKNNSNKVFTVDDAYVSGSITISYNGQQLYSPDDFLETGANEITFIYIAPYDDDVLRATYEIQ